MNQVILTYSRSVALLIFIAAVFFILISPGLGAVDGTPLIAETENITLKMKDFSHTVCSGMKPARTTDFLIRNNRMFGFDTLSPGQSSVMSSYLINIETQTLTLDSIHIMENVPGAFTWLNPSLPYTVPVNDSVLVAIQFAPEQVLFYGGQIHVFSSSISSPDTFYIGGTVSASQVNYPYTLLPWQFTMISVPGILSDPDIESSLSYSLGAYDAENWRVFYWKNDNYLELKQFSNSDNLTLKPGLGYWLICSDTAGIILQNISATSPIVYEGQFARAAYYPIPLQPGWNMIGDPFAYSIPWNQIVESDLVYRPVSYNGSTYTYQLEILSPWEGVFVYNPQDTMVTLYVPPFPSVPKSSKNQIAEHGFSVGIQAYGLVSGMSSSQNQVGMLETANDGFDKNDYPEAPPIGSCLRLSIVENGVFYAGNFHAVNTEGARWDLNLNTTGIAEMTSIRFSELNRLPEGFQIWVLDKDHETIFSAAQGQIRIAVPDSGEVVHLSLIVGTQLFMESESGGIPLQPLDYALLPNAPNPFNPKTIIEFHLAQKSSVNLQIYNIKGQQVRSLIHAVMSAGRHIITWDGLDDSGCSAESGIYFCRIQCPSFQATQKMILLR